jgi:UDP-glucose 4-epimerase
VQAMYANNDFARNQLGWNPKYSLDEMMDTAWKWELKLKADETIFTGIPSELN